MRSYGPVVPNQNLSCSGLGKEQHWPRASKPQPNVWPTTKQGCEPRSLSTLEWVSARPVTTLFTAGAQKEVACRILIDSTLLAACELAQDALQRSTSLQQIIKKRHNIKDTHQAHLLVIHECYLPATLVDSSWTFRGTVDYAVGIVDRALMGRSLQRLGTMAH
jgi:hypothetical protein